MRGALALKNSQLLPGSKVPMSVLMTQAVCTEASVHAAGTFVGNPVDDDP